MKLGEWMEESQLDDAAVAARVRSDRSTISRVRRGMHKPSWELVEKLRDVSDGKVTANDFLDDPANGDAQAKGAA